LQPQNSFFMKHIFLLLIGCVAFISCDDVSFSDLPGKWQLKTVEKEGHITEVDTVWYNFQSESAFGLQVYMPENKSYKILYGMRTQQNNVISIELLYDNYAGITDWTSRQRSFTVDKVGCKQLILRSEDDAVYSFIRF